MNRKAQRLVLVCALALFLGACTTANKKAKPDGPVTPLFSASATSSVVGNVVLITVTNTVATIVKADGDTSGKTGHFHVFIDREPVAAGVAIPKEAGIVHSTDNPIKITGLKVGKHTFVVVLGDGTHTRIGQLKSRFTVNIMGPSVQGSIPAANTAGQPVVVSLTSEGVTIKAADGDASGTTGHYHVFIDRDPTPAGQAIPKETGIVHTIESSVNLEGLASGDHFIWAVLGDGNHLPLAGGNVAHKITFTIA